MAGARTRVAHAIVSSSGCDSGTWTWAAKSAAHRAGVAPSRWNLRPQNRLSAVRAGIPRSRSYCRGCRPRSGGQPHFRGRPPGRPLPSVSGDVNQGGEMQVLPGQLDAFDPSVFAVDGVRHDSRAGHPKRVPGIVQPLLVERSICGVRKALEVLR